MRPRRVLKVIFDEDERSAMVWLKLAGSGRAPGQRACKIGMHMWGGPTIHSLGLRQHWSIKAWHGWKNRAGVTPAALAEVGPEQGPGQVNLRVDGKRACMQHLKSLLFSFRIFSQIAFLSVDLSLVVCMVYI